MSESQPKKPASETEEGIEVAHSVNWKNSIEPDHVLQTLVDLANVTEVSLGISLNVGGFLVCGYLVSGRVFFDGVANEMGEAFKQNGETSAAMKSYFSNFGDIYDKIDEDEDRELPTYVHLKDARFFHNAGTAMPGNRGVWWRGRLSSVSGFCMGTLSAG